MCGNLSPTRLRVALLAGGLTESLQLFASKTSRWMKPQRQKTALVLLGLLLLCVGGCFGTRANPDRTVTHQLAETTTVKVWVRLPDGRRASQEVKLTAGDWWLVHDALVNPPAGDGQKP